MSTTTEQLNAKQQRSGQLLGVYLLLRKGETALLSLRKNTGYFDGYYGLVSGHVEDGESMIAAMIREAKEEANLTISPKSLQIVHLMHRKTDECRIDVFFDCTDWEGEIINVELDKCGGLHFFSFDNLPNNVIPYVRQALEAATEHKMYSETGWALSSTSDD